MEHLRAQWRAAQRYSFEVAWSQDKDTLKSGEVVSGYSKVVVEAEGEVEARLIAEQMVAATGKEPTGATRVASLSMGEAYRGIPVRIRDRETGLALIDACVKGSWRVAADILIESMATGARDRWWSYEQGPDDEAGRWWTGDRRAAYSYSDSRADDDDFLVVPVLLTAQFNEDSWQHGLDLDFGGTPWWHIDPGTPLTITKFEADLPDRQTLKAWEDEVESQGEWAVHNAAANYAMGNGWRALPIAPMRTTASHPVLEGEVALDYPYHGRPLRLYVKDPSFEGDRGSTYFKEPGVIAFVDVFDQGVDLYVGYVTVARPHRGKGLARLLMQAVYDRFYDGTKWINWGDIMADEAETLYRDFKGKYPLTTGRL